MSSVTDEHKVDNTSTYEVLDEHSSNKNHIKIINNSENTMKPYSNNNINDLIDHLMCLINERLDNAQQCKNMFYKNSMQLAFYQVLSEIKDKIALNTQQISNIDDQTSEQLIRVDNMLIAEGIFERCSSTNLSLTKKFDHNYTFDYSDYRTKLDQMRQIYYVELEKYENHCNDFCSHVRTLLREQSQIRPISEHEIEHMIKIIRKKFSTIQLQLKQSTCEAVMVLRSKSLDARRKRRNFSKLATEVLNAYFYSHLSNPYPSDEAKEELARQCGISVAQVCNWFGNKRIRYKKNMHKTQEEANIYAAKIALQAVRHNRDSLSNDY
ncbi:unnamed protein product [Rotaria sordida]|uniref:Uncharacterized protein n=1 Tax=Rotaria sordida TaxID=392033 RepID=A0A819IRQ7_9BILA|nr:unnamed protein product [Rotaria sordida]CAF0759881.1 unnamed protein product [Rotaria sordida]CAF0843260.1 unnamed protein product [Rotaria sordida]CAF0852845.1 unnamed protein product [Rotaria sordida]CAF3506258.1 unnamed protein product [Rotaria sordida]